MTEEQGAAEIQYRLCKLFLRHLRNENKITLEQEIECRRILLDKIKPFVSSLEVDIEWLIEKSLESSH